MASQSVVNPKFKIDESKRKVNFETSFAIVCNVS